MEEDEEGNSVKRFVYLISERRRYDDDVVFDVSFNMQNVYPLRVVFWEFEWKFDVFSEHVIFAGCHRELVRINGNRLAWLRLIVW